MTNLALGLIMGATLALTAFDGPEPRDRTTNKPPPEQCAAAAREGRTLLGCADEGESSPSPPAEVDQAGPPSRFMVCPQDPRCPR